MSEATTFVREIIEFAGSVFDRIGDRVDNRHNIFVDGMALAFLDLLGYIKLVVPYIVGLSRDDADMLINTINYYLARGRASSANVYRALFESDMMILVGIAGHARRLSRRPNINNRSALAYIGLANMITAVSQMVRSSQGTTDIDDLNALLAYFKRGREDFVAAYGVRGTLPAREEEQLFAEENVLNPFQMNVLRNRNPVGFEMQELVTAGINPVSGANINFPHPFYLRGPAFGSASGSGFDRDDFDINPAELSEFTLYSYNKSISFIRIAIKISHIVGILLVPGIISYTDRKITEALRSRIATPISTLSSSSSDMIIPSNSDEISDLISDSSVNVDANVSISPSPFIETYVSPSVFPGETPTVSPIESPVESPVEFPVESPVESPIVSPIVSPVESPIESPIMSPAPPPSPTPPSDARGLLDYVAPAALPLAIPPILKSSMDKGVDMVSGAVVDVAKASSVSAVIGRTSPIVFVIGGILLALVAASGK